MAEYSVHPNEAVPYAVRYEDDEVVVVDKPARVVTQPGLGHEHDTLLNGLFARWGARLQNLGRERDFGLLHRLDRETSGLVIVPLRARAYDALRGAFERREVKKFYWAVVTRAPEPASGVIKLALAEFEGTAKGRGGKERKLARVSSGGKAAVTAYRVLEASAHGALLECRAVTGRLHQIRVHLEAIGSAIVGDGLYGERGGVSSPRLALHAHRVVFAHPTTGAEVDVRSEWPGDLRGVLRKMGLKRPGEERGTTEEGGE